MRARAAAIERVGTVEFEYRRIYNLTVNDPRFLDATVDEMLTDIFAHQFKNDPKSMDEVEDDDFDPDNVAAELNANNPDDWEEVSKK